mmetsp:Transcript_893/g.3314  ORF Transcript_893/g.3314 Transcript_893/m.3314 type:complete len:223 (-) Transcript_893:3817-4485(-)
MAPAGEPVKAKLSRGAALGFIALSSLGFSVQALLVKLLTLDHENGVPPMQIVFVRGCSQLFCCFIVLATHCELRRHPKRWFGDSALEVKWLTARGSVGFFGIAFGFKAFSLLGLAEANVISSSSPVFSAVYAKVFLGEPWLLLERCAAAVTAAAVAERKLASARKQPDRSPRSELFRGRRAGALLVPWSELRRCCSGGATASASGSAQSSSLKDQRAGLSPV